MTGSINYYDEGLGANVEKGLLTQSVEDEENQLIAENNAQLVFDFSEIHIDKDWLDMGCNWMEAAIMTFFSKFKVKSGNRFYFTNNQLAYSFRTSSVTISKTISSLTRKGLLKPRYKRKSNGGQIRFIDSGDEPTLRKLMLLHKESLSSNLKKVNGNNNNINNNNINNNIYTSQNNQESQNIRNEKNKQNNKNNENNRNELNNKNIKNKYATRDVDAFEAVRDEVAERVASNRGVTKSEVIQVFYELIDYCHTNKNARNYLDLERVLDNWVRRKFKSNTSKEVNEFNIF